MNQNTNPQDNGQEQGGRPLPTTPPSSPPAPSLGTSSGTQGGGPPAQPSYTPQSLEPGSTTPTQSTPYPSYQAPPPPHTPHPYYPPYEGAPTGPEEQYRWDYNHYEPFHKSPAPQRNKGLVAFLIFLLSSLVVGVVTLTIVTFWTMSLPNDLSGGEAIPPIYGENDSALNQGQTPAGSQGNELTIPPSGELLTIPQVAAKVKPSVVGISRYQNTLYEPTGVGSGFIYDIVDGKAYVITNQHVVANGTNFKVMLNDATEFDAILVGEDQESDLALLQIDASEDMIAAEVGDSDALLVGETVIAIGNPVSQELSGSVTGGLVSALDRKLSTENTINYIQIDAAINPGNSGGALVNQYGQVVGINTMKISGMGYEGIGFAIPMADALPIMEELRANGRVTSRPVLGIVGEIITEADARYMNAPAGILVREVGDNAQFDPEIKEQDIITHVDGERILGIGDLRRVLNKHKIGDQVGITVHRPIDTVKREEVTLTATLVKPEEE